MSMSSHLFRNPYSDVDVIDQVEQFVMEHLNDPEVDVSFLCDSLGLSRTTLHNRVKSLTNMSTTEYIRFLRLTRAKELLEDPSLYISEIAYSTGFQNHNYFSKRFRELFGVTPKEWREQQNPT